MAGYAFPTPGCSGDRDWGTLSAVEGRVASVERKPAWSITIHGEVEVHAAMAIQHTIAAENRITRDLFTPFN